MKINKVKSSEYNTVNKSSLYRYIHNNLDAIQALTTAPADDAEHHKRLMQVNNAQLKAIAAELETVKRRLEYELNGKY